MVKTCCRNDREKKNRKKFKDYNKAKNENRPLRVRIVYVCICRLQYWYTDTIYLIQLYDHPLYYFTSLLYTLLFNYTPPQEKKTVSLPSFLPYNSTRHPSPPHLLYWSTSLLHTIFNNIPPSSPRLVLL